MNKDRMREYQRKWYLSRREDPKFKRKKYENAKRWDLNNKEKRAESRKKYYLKNKKYFTEYAIRYRKNNPEKVRLACRLRRKRYSSSPVYKKLMLEASKRYSKKYRFKISCREKSRRALKNGLLVKPKQCQGCGKENVKIQMHHEDYSKPLEVKFLCGWCHSRIHI